MAARVASVSAERQKSVMLRRSRAAARSTRRLVSASTRKPSREARARRSAGEAMVADCGMGSLLSSGTISLYVQWENNAILVRVISQVPKCEGPGAPGDGSCPAGEIPRSSVNGRIYKSSRVTSEARPASYLQKPEDSTLQQARIGSASEVF